MVKKNTTYTWNNHVAIVTAVCGLNVYYKDQCGCYFRTSVSEFSKMYNSLGEYQFILQYYNVIFVPGYYRDYHRSGDADGRGRKLGHVSSPLR